MSIDKIVEEINERVKKISEIFGSYVDPMLSGMIRDYALLERGRYDLDSETNEMPLGEVVEKFYPGWKPEHFGLFLDKIKETYEHLREEVDYARKRAKEEIEY